MLKFDFHDPMSRRFVRAMRRQCFVTTPSSIVNRLTGTETWPDPVNFSGGIQNQVMPNLAIAAATTTLTLTPAAHSGKTLVIASTGGLAITPPAATGTFCTYTFVVLTTVSGGNFTFDAKAGNASDLIYGVANGNKVGTGVVQWGTAANTNLITWNGSTLGGIKGDWMQLTDIGLNMWQCDINGQQSGTAATPFSNH